jgi:hypothetical protein
MQASPCCSTMLRWLKAPASRWFCRASRPSNLHFLTHRLSVDLCLLDALPASPLSTARVRPATVGESSASLVTKAGKNGRRQRLLGHAPRSTRIHSARRWPPNGGRGILPRLGFSEVASVGARSPNHRRSRVRHLRLHRSDLHGDDVAKSTAHPRDLGRCVRRSEPRKALAELRRTGVHAPTPSSRPSPNRAPIPHDATSALPPVAASTTTSAVISTEPPWCFSLPGLSSCAGTDSMRRERRDPVGGPPASNVSDTLPSQQTSPSRPTMAIHHREPRLQSSAVSESGLDLNTSEGIDPRLTRRLS